MWVYSLVAVIPGKIGCIIRRALLPINNGLEVYIWDNVHIDKPSLLKIKNNVSINRGSVIHAGGGVSIGDDVLIGPGVIIYSQNHEFETGGLVRDQGYSLKPVFIDSNVWIAANAIILPGVSIGSGSVVAAGSVVTKDVESNTLVAGNPARFIRHIKQRNEHC